MRRARAGFTLVETLIAMMLTAVLVMAVFGGLSFIGSGYRRDELAMARSQVATKVFEALAADVAAVHGTAIAPQNALDQSGYQGDEQSFLRETRRGTHVVQLYRDREKRPQAVLELPYREHAIVGGIEWLYDQPKCRFEVPLRLEPAPSPWGAQKALFVVPLPPDDPEVVYLPLAVWRAGRIEPVLWSFFRRRRGRFEAGAILRHGPDGVSRFFETARLAADLKLKTEWVHHEGPREKTLEAVETVIQIELGDTQDLVLPFSEQRFRAARSLTVGL